MTSRDQEYWILWYIKVGGTLGNGSYLKVMRHVESSLLITWFLLCFFFSAVWSVIQNPVHFEIACS